MTLEFRPWPKTPRLFRDITITEKIDGTNAAVIVQAVPPVLGKDPYNPAVHGPVVGQGDEFALITLDGNWLMVGAQSRNRLVKPTQDNAGFAGWVFDNAEELACTLGEGYHYGEWWGQGIQRRYGLQEKRFSLFNVHRYAPLLETAPIERVSVVPTLYVGPYSEAAVQNAVIGLRNGGSWAAPGYANPEGVVVYHSASQQVFKVLLENDEIPKGLAA